jgi:hypothetical protein
MYQFNYQAGKRALQFVVGLRWQPLVPDSFRKNLIPLSIELRADLYVYRKSGKSMIGFAGTDSGARAGQIPLALAIASTLDRESKPNNALIAVSLPEADGRCAYLMIRDGYVLAGYDRVGPEAEIREAFFADLSTDDGWDILICPADWEVNGSTERDIESLLPKKAGVVKIPDTWRLRPVKPSRIKSVLIFAAIAAVSFAVVKGYQWWQQAKMERVAMQIAAEQAQAVELARQQKISTLPWLAMPSPVDFAAACEGALDATKVIVPGWNFTGFRCQGAALSVSWTRDPKSGLIASMKAIHPQVTFSPDALQATISAPIKVEPSASMGVQQDIPPANDRLDQLRDYPLMYGFSLTIAPGQRGPRTVDGVVLPWTDFRFSVEGVISPSSMAVAIAAPGLRIESISGSITSGLFKYQLQGIQYAKP